MRSENEHLPLIADEPDRMRHANGAGAAAAIIGMAALGFLISFATAAGLIWKALR